MPRDVRSLARLGGAGVSVSAPAPTNGGDVSARTSAFGLSFAPARAEISEAVTTGRLSLSVLLVMTLGLVAFYTLTRNVQGGG